MKRFVLLLGLLLVPLFTFVGIPDGHCQVPFNDINTSHPIAGDPNNYWCFDCHYFENIPPGDKWVKEQIETLPFHTAYPVGTLLNVFFPFGTTPELVTDTCPTNCGPCQACHTQTEMNGYPVWRNDGTGKDHGGGDFGTDCTACHPHWDDRYMFYPAGGGTGPSHDIHLRDPIKGPKKWDGSAWVNIGCDDCHVSPYPNLINGPDLATTDVCDPCHSKEGAFDGVDDPVIGAKPNWVSPDGPSKIYNASGTALNSGKKDWCLGCHDRHQGTSFIGNAYAPPVAGDNNKYGYKISGHGRPDIGLNCEDCHNLGIIHIDGRQRSYQANWNNHRIGYRLSIGSAVPRDFDDTYETGAFNTCTYSCHKWDSLVSNPGTGGGVPATGFRGATYLNYCGAVQNWHWEHLDPDKEFLCGDSDYDGTVDSRQTCILCHNVHGSRIVDNAASPTVVVPNPVMIRDGFLISTANTGFVDKVPAFDFKLFRGSCTTVGAQTDNHDLSRWGTMECGDMTGSLGENNVCFGCHPSSSGPFGPIKYYREPTLTIKRVWIADPSTDNEITSATVGGPVRYKVEFTVAGPPSRPYVRTHPSLTKAENAPGFSPAWSTPFAGAGSPYIGTHVWATESILPTAWDLTIPGTATPGTDAARVLIPLGMYNQAGGTLLDYDYGPAPGTGGGSAAPADYYYFDLN